MANRVIMLDADAGTVVETYIKGKVVPMWVRSGQAEIIHDADVLRVLSVGDRIVCDGLSPGAALSVRAVVGNTTVVFDDG